MDYGGVATVSTASSAAVGREEVASSQFPAGLRVLVVDDDPTCLKILDKMLRNCLYNVTVCSRAAIALSLLRERKGGFDLVLSDVYMPDMDGFKLLEHIGLEMDLPVIMMSADGGRDVVMKGVTHGACDYLIKPVRMEAIKNIWQHVVRKRRNEMKELEHSGSVEENDKQRKQLDDGESGSLADEGNCKNAKRMRDGNDLEDEVEEYEDSSSHKKPRVVWSIELHQQFVAAVKQLGIDKAVPKKILELMNVPGITRENVASHLQKYRLYLRRVSEVHQHQGRLDIPFTGTSEAAFGLISSLDGFDLQTLAASGHFPAQSLMTLQDGPRKATNTALGFSIVDQMGFFNSETQIVNSSKKQPASGQELNNKNMNLLREPSTTIESRQLEQSQHVVQSYGNMGGPVSIGSSGFLELPTSLRTSSSFSRGTFNGHPSNSIVMQMTQPKQPFALSQNQNLIHTDRSRQLPIRGELVNGIACEQDFRLSPAFGSQILSNEISGRPQILSNEISGRVSGRSGTNANEGTLLPGTYMSTSSYSAVPQTPNADFRNNCTTGSGGSCYPLASSLGVSRLMSIGMSQEAVPATRSLAALDNSTTLKGVRSFIPSYDVFSELPQNKSQDWKLQSINPLYESALQLCSTESNLDVDSSRLAHQGYIGTRKDGNTCTVSKDMFTARTEVGHGNVECIAQQSSNVLGQNSVRVKAESVQNFSCGNSLFYENIIPNELMNIVAKQQEGVRQAEAEAEFNFDGCGYHLDNIPG